MGGERNAQRRRRWGRAGTGVAALLCVLLPLAAGARPPHQGREGDHARGEGRPPAQQQPQNGISLDQAIAMAERRYKARVVRANTTESEGRRFHVLRLLSEEGRVWTVRIDAATGQER